MGRHAQGIMQIFHSYDSTELRVAAIETLIQTEIEHAKETARNDASDVCEGLHVGPGIGLKCRQCYEAEQRFHLEEQITAEREVKTDENS